jgi:hypothetical protein
VQWHARLLEGIAPSSILQRIIALEAASEKSLGKPRQKITKIGEHHKDLKMPNNSTDQADSKTLGLNETSIFGPAPILDGEDSEAYNDLLARVSGDVNPTGMIEEIWVRDVVDLAWEIFRWRRLKAALFSQAVSYALLKRLAPLMRRKSAKNLETVTDISILAPSFYRPIPSSTHKLAKKWANRDPAAVDRVNKLMASANITMDAVMADALIEKLGNIERIDHLIAIAEGRRNSILREVDRHRAALAENLRVTVDDVEEAEFEIIGKKVA